jgi:hypothetical protein
VLLRCAVHWIAVEDRFAKKGGHLLVYKEGLL